MLTKVPNIASEHGRNDTVFLICSRAGDFFLPGGSRRERENARRPVSRVLSSPCGRGRPFLWDAPCGAPHATNPGDGARTPLRHAAPVAPGRAAGHPYSVLLPVGFTLPPPSPGERCALAAPFHPCPQALPRAGGLFSVALSLGSPPPAVNRHRVPVEPGLSSTPSSRQRSSSRLAFG